MCPPPPPHPQDRTQVFKYCSEVFYPACMEEEWGVQIVRRNVTKPDVHMIEPFCSLLIVLFSVSKLKQLILL
jgi:hypothetical protein